MKSTLMIKLLTAGHLDAVAKQELGADSITLADIALAIQQVLQDNRYFPPDQAPWKPGEAVYEGFIIESWQTGNSARITSAHIRLRRGSWRRANIPTTKIRTHLEKIFSVGNGIAGLTIFRSRKGCYGIGSERFDIQDDAR